MTTGAVPIDVHARAVVLSRYSMWYRLPATRTRRSPIAAEVALVTNAPPVLAPLATYFSPVL